MIKFKEFYQFATKRLDNLNKDEKSMWDARARSLLNATHQTIEKLTNNKQAIKFNFDNFNYSLNDILQLLYLEQNENKQRKLSFFERLSGNTCKPKSSLLNTYVSALPYTSNVGNSEAINEVHEYVAMIIRNLKNEFMSNQINLLDNENAN